MDIKLIILMLIIGVTIDSAISKKGVIVTRATYIARFTEPTNASSTYTALTLSREWPAVGRLVLTVTGAFLGTLLNIFFISSFCCEDSLSRKGNVFLACMGLTDLIITGGVIPVPAILIISGQWDTTYLCSTIQIITEASTYCYTILIMLVSIETYIRLCQPLSAYIKFISWPLGMIVFIIYIFGASMAATGVYLKLDYDYCLRQNTGNFNYRVATTVIFHIIPLLVTLRNLVFASLTVIRRADEQAHYRRSQQYNLDLTTTYLNIANLLFYITMWLPHNIIAFFFLDVTDRIYYNFAWVGISRSIFSSFLYATMHKTIRKTFVHLFKYCCCKNNLPSPLRNHHGRNIRSTGDVQIFEMQTYHRYYESRDSSLMAMVDL